MTLLDVARPHSFNMANSLRCGATLRSCRGVDNLPRGDLPISAMAAHMHRMMIPRLRVALGLSVVAAALVLGTAFASEWYGGLVPCALCLVERWPYRIAIAIGLIGLVLPRWLARVALALVALTMVGAAATAVVHVGVELLWWPSPLPECAAPHFSGGSIAQRLASMPLTPSKACDEPTYLIAWLPVSMAEMNLICALALGAAITMFLRSTSRSDP